jgi:hypothetical protein
MAGKSQNIKKKPYVAFLIMGLISAAMYTFLLLKQTMINNYFAM